MKTVLLVAVALYTSQPTVGPADGTWVAEFAGRTFIKLQLTSSNGTVTGAISLGNFEVDGQGVVRRADEAPLKLTPIVNVAMSGTSLRFSKRNESDADRFALRWLDAGRAELEVLLNAEDREELAASGVTAPKPIPLRRLN
jgi:hypothetical protein